MTALSLFAKTLENPNMKRMACIGGKKQKNELFTTDKWKKIACINILLFAEKLRDNIHDDNSILARILSMIFSKCIKNARRDFPNIYSLIKDGYNLVLDDEKQNLGAPVISADFADMMINIIKDNFSLRDKDIKIIRAIARWLYFIDALDDYDKDARKKRFNPLSNPGLKYKEYVNTHYKEIYLVLYDILHEVNDGEILKNSVDAEDLIIKSLIEYTIPVTTSNILNGLPLPRFRHRHIHLIERTYIMNRRLSKIQRKLMKLLFKNGNQNERN